MESMETRHKQPTNYRQPPRDRGSGRKSICTTTRGPLKRLTRPEETVVFARKQVLRSSIPRVLLAAIPPVNAASMAQGVL